MDIQNKEALIAQINQFKQTQTFKYFYSTLLHFDESLNCFVATEKWRDKEAELLTAAWWMFAELAKAQAVPEGFVLVPKLLSDELADELASGAFNNIQSMFDYEHRGSTATHREQIRLRWCKNKAHQIMRDYKAMIEWMEQKA